MNARVASALAALLVAITSPPAAAQNTVVTGPGGATPFTLEAAGGGDPFATSPLAAAGPTEVIGVTPNPVRPTAVAKINTNVGFSYLRPYWQADGLALRVPVGNNRAVAVVDPAGDLSRSYGFVPRVDLTYDLPAFGVGMSAQFIGIGGNLDRTVTLNGRSADLVATSDLSILVVTLAELSKPFTLRDYDGHLVTALGMGDDLFVASIGTRYASVRQHWHASLRGGDAIATSDATQTFTGLGLTAGLSTDHPIGRYWGLFTTNRWSLLLGQNSRKSTAIGADAAGPFNNTLVENKTTLFPAGEVDLGVRFSTPVDDARPDGTLITVRVAFTGQYWSNVGFLPASSAAARFDDRPLFLAGFTVLAGLEY